MGSVQPVGTRALPGQRLGAALALGIALMATSACSSSHAGTSAAKAGPATDVASTVSATDVKTWPAQWCHVQIGMTRTQVRALMGAPTDEFGPETGTPQMSWSAYEYQFNAFFDINDKVRQLDINMSQLTSAEKAALTCDQTRKAR
jgi:hypothetical protein